MGGKKGFFRRPGRTWSFVVGLNYIYIPILLAIVGGFGGTFYGAHSCAERFIDDTARPLSNYGHNYFQQAISILPEIKWDKHPNKTLDEVLAHEMAQRIGASPGTTAYPYLMVINQSVIQHVVREANVSDKIDPLKVANYLQNHRLASNAFIGLPRTLHEQCDGFFWIQYAWIAWIFLPFLLLPWIEYFFFRLVTRRK
jgi:hypothetical protein